MIRGPESILKHYKIGDRIRVRAQFTHLYPAESGVIVGIVADSMRAIFNEYVVEFPDQTSASLFQFQILRVESMPTDSLQSRSA